MSLGKNEFFVYTSLEELKEEYNKLLREAKEVSLDMERELKKVSFLESKVPSDAKSSTLRDSLNNSKIKKDIFDDLIRKLNKNIDYLLSELPETDDISSESMSKLTEATKILTDMINDYREFVTINLVNISNQDFNRTLRKLHLQSSLNFNTIDENIREALRTIQRLDNRYSKI